MIAAPEIAAAQALAAEHKKTIDAMPAPRTGIAIVAATGSDPEGESVYALINPVPAGAPLLVIRLEAAGQATLFGFCPQRRGRPVIKLVKLSSEVGLVYGDGIVDLHSA